MNATLRFVLGTAAAVALSFVALPAAQAQKDAGAKIRGDVYWPSKASSRYLESARNYAQDVQTYVQKAPKPEPSVVKEIKTELGRYLDESQKHLATMKKDFASDKETVAAVESLEKQLTTAIEHNKMMIACCENEKFDKVATMSCCTDLVKELDKVYKDHTALMQKLTAKHASAAPAAKK